MQQKGQRPHTHTHTHTVAAVVSPSSVLSYNERVLQSSSV